MKCFNAFKFAYVHCNFYNTITLNIIFPSIETESLDASLNLTSLI